jgi:MoaA/NifB/PqqE/SkfB family radical SAM enzyme
MAGHQVKTQTVLARLTNRFEGLGRRLFYLSPTDTSPFGPKWLVLVVNNICNLHCKMCDVGTGTEGTMFYKNLIGGTPGVQMSTEVFDRLLSDAARFPIRPKVSFSYTEPGIHPRLVEMVARTKAAGFSATVVTNGFTLPRLAQPLVDAGLDELFVSLDGTRDAHNLVRGSARSYDKIIEGLARVSAARKAAGVGPSVSVIFVFTEQSYRTLVALLDELAVFAPINVIATLLNFVSADLATTHNARFGESYPATSANVSEVDLTSFDVRALLEQMHAAEARAEQLGLNLSLHPRAIRSEDQLRTYFSRPSEPVAGDHCTDPWQMAMVQTNGDVVPAHGRCFNTIVGNIMHRPLAEIWDGPEMRAFRRTLKVEGGRLPACTRCCGCYDRHSTLVERAVLAGERLLAQRHAASTTPRGPAVQGDPARRHLPLAARDMH